MKNYQSFLQVSKKIDQCMHSVRYLVQNVLDELYELGKGISRTQLEKQMQELTGIKQSYFIHTSTTKIRYERAMMRFCDYLEEYGIKRDKHLNEISKEKLERIIDNYFRWLVEQGFSTGTIKIHISAMGKILAVLRPDLIEFLSNDDRRIGWWINGKASKKGDSYVDPESIRERLVEEHRIIAEVQALAGFRIREILKATINKERYEITIHNAKGGKTIKLYFKYRKEKFERLVELIEKIDKNYEKKLKDYYRDLKKACTSTEQTYNASYGFRYEYVQKRVKELMANKEELRYLLEKYNASKEIKNYVDDENKIDKAIDFVIANELGHDRLKTSRYYYI